MSPQTFNNHPPTLSTCAVAVLAFTPYARQTRLTYACTHAPPPCLILAALARSHLPARQERCLICFDEFPRADMRAAACKHYFCKECWRGYISNAIASGPASLDLRCPSTDCKAKAAVSNSREQAPCAVAPVCMHAGEGLGMGRAA